MVPLSKNCWLGFFYMWCMSAKWQQLSFVYSWKFPTRQRCIGHILLGDVILISTFYKQPKHWTLVSSLSISLRPIPLPSSNGYLIIISSFLEKFNINIYNNPKKELNALYLPIYGITLWRVFPKQKMNMWLYRQSLSSCYRKETKPNLSFLSPVSALLLWYVGIIVYIILSFCR